MDNKNDKVILQNSMVIVASCFGAWRYVFGLARRGSTIGFHLLWHTVKLAMSTRLCLL